MVQRARHVSWIIGTAAVVLAVAVAGFVKRQDIAVALAPKKRAATTRTPAAVAADSLFWHAFHGGTYDDIPRVLEALTAAYLESPSDAVTAAHIAWFHNWRIAERARLAVVPASITDETIVARRYFDEAVRLNRSDPRTQGFLAGHMLADATLEHDERLLRRGYFMMLHAIDEWPEFNLFTGGYVMSRLPPSSPRFKEGLEWEWRNLDVCIDGRIDRANPDYTKYMRLETKSGVKRVCWNSWIAPHNFEGFFLNMGDMLVKSGDWQTAQKIYANAKLSRDFASWKYADVLEARITGARDNVSAFRDTSRTPALPIMLNSAFACMACHRQ